MKNLNTTEANVQNLTNEEMLTIVGGSASYAAYTWSGTTNPLIFAGEAGVNGAKAIYNGCAWLYNQL